MKDRERIRQLQRERHARIRAECIAKLGGSCVNCGSTESLEFHHRSPRHKEFGRIPSLNERDRKRELKKCELLCSRCHRLTTGSAHESVRTLRIRMLQNRRNARIVSFMSTQDPSDP